jgi:SAM-dependent methyltransferase
MSDAGQDFVVLTEVAGDGVSLEQIDRLARRYYWAADYCRARTVAEVACGSGQGSGYLASQARFFTAGDFSPALLSIAAAYYRGRVPFQRLDAQRLPYRNAAFDVVVMFEALYYIPKAELFFAECRRVLKPGGVLLIATANKDLFDFNPSPASYTYFGVVELAAALKQEGCDVAFFGDSPVGETSMRQQVLRPVKAAAVSLGLMPKSMRGKKLLKRLVFGGLTAMPAEISGATAPHVAPVALDPSVPDRKHKVIFCAATVPR